MPYVGQSVTDLFDEPVQLLTENAARAMCDEAGDSIKKIAETNTPVRTGKLRASWKKGDAKPEGTGKFAIDVSNSVEYAAYVENGTGIYGPRHAPYTIFPRNPGGVLRWMGRDGQVVFAKYVVHPGSPGNYMLEIAMNVTDSLAQGDVLFAGTLEKWVREVEAQANR